jgi:hypothetical protein
MPKCSDCGFLAVWMRKEHALQEASEYFRYHGYPEHIPEDETVYQPKCFLRAYDLVEECETARGNRKGGLTEHAYALHIKNVIQERRSCPNFRLWEQGFSPKDHAARQYQEEQLAKQHKHENLTLLVAMIGVVASLVGIAVGAYFNHEAAQIEADATRESARQQIEAIDRQTTTQIQAQKELTQMQIEAQKALAPPAPAIIKPGTKTGPPVKAKPHP